jgi:hypothetical protein
MKLAFVVFTALSSLLFNSGIAEAQVSCSGVCYNEMPSCSFPMYPKQSGTCWTCCFSTRSVGSIIPWTIASYEINLYILYTIFYHHNEWNNAGVKGVEIITSCALIDTPFEATFHIVSKLQIQKKEDMGVLTFQAWHDPCKCYPW